MQADTQRQWSHSQNAEAYAIEADCLSGPGAASGIYVAVPSAVPSSAFPPQGDSTTTRRIRFTFDTCSTWASRSRPTTEGVRVRAVGDVHLSTWTLKSKTRVVMSSSISHCTAMVRVSDDALVIPWLIRTDVSLLRLAAATAAVVTTAALAALLIVCMRVYKSPSCPRRGGHTHVPFAPPSQFMWARPTAQSCRSAPESVFNPAGEKPLPHYRFVVSGNYVFWKVFSNNKDLPRDLNSEESHAAVGDTPSHVFDGATPSLPGYRPMPDATSLGGPMTPTNAPRRDAHSDSLTQSEAHKVGTVQVYADAYLNGNYSRADVTLALRNAKWIASAAKASLFEGDVLKAGPSKTRKHARGAASATATASSSDTKDKRAKSARSNAPPFAHALLPPASGAVKIENLTALDAEIDVIMASPSVASASRPSPPDTKAVSEAPVGSRAASHLGKTAWADFFVAVCSTGGTDAAPNDAAIDRALDLMGVQWTPETRSQVVTFVAAACAAQKTSLGRNGKATNDYPDGWSVLSLLPLQMDASAKTAVVDEADVVLADDHALEGTSMATSEAKCAALNAACRQQTPSSIEGARGGAASAGGRTCHDRRRPRRQNDTSGGRGRGAPRTKAAAATAVREHVQARADAQVASGTRTMDSALMEAMKVVVEGRGNKEAKAAYALWETSRRDVLTAWHDLQEAMAADHLWSALQDMLTHVVALRRQAMTRAARAQVPAADQATAFSLRQLSKLTRGLVMELVRFNSALTKRMALATAKLATEEGELQVHLENMESMAILGDDAAWLSHDVEEKMARYRGMVARDEVLMAATVAEQERQWLELCDDTTGEVVAILGDACRRHCNDVDGGPLGDLLERCAAMDQDDVQGKAATREASVSVAPSFCVVM
ncbi:Aste57867_23015 [Aphanomyces stellatus]|uniref:Aste57867_23015 protein n=1 Tax=Aphanomyces stellatus TaxID=120398 RepID=A0A485LLQ7_9STRA|nr:hypothetical protein As57867_022944 [Aphanomyces stellatus]VFT99663.1 Aste57867_23015 [Aphanomyces stellatus]